MTYVTGFFLVFAGMLIGYFLWYRDRSEDERQKTSLANENEDLRASLANLRDNHQQIEERCSRQKGQLNVLQQLCDDWSTNREQSERERAELESELEVNRKKLESTTSELQHSKQKLIELDDQAHALIQKHLDQKNQTEQKWQTKLDKLESLVEQRDHELKSAVRQNENLSKSLHQSEAKIAELTSQIETNKNLLETATRNASGLKQEYVSVESSLKQSNDQLNKARSETAAALSEKKLAQQTLAALKNAHQQLQSEVSDLNAKASTSSALEQDLAALKKSFANNQQQLEKVTRQRDEALQIEKSAAAVTAGLQTRINNQESTIHKLREQYKDALRKAKSELDARVQQETISADQQHVLSNQVAELKNRLVAQVRQIETHTQRIDSEFKQKAAALDQQLADKNQQLDAQSVRLSELTKQAAAHDQLSHELDAELTELRTRYKQLKKQHVELQLQGFAESGSVQEIESLKAEHDRKIAVVQAKLKSSEQTIRSLRRERAAVLARLANYRSIAEPDSTVISFKQAMEQRKRETYCQEYGGYVEEHPERGRIYTAQPKKRDDLKRISGIAEVLEARLNDYGIYTFKQIMDWQPSVVEEFGRLLTFRDRIERDDWQGQARILYGQKHARAAA